MAVPPHLGGPPGQMGGPDPSVQVLLQVAHSQRMAQYQLVDSHNVVAAALLGFEAVLIPLIKATNVHKGCLVASVILLAASIALLIFCLVGLHAGWPPFQEPVVLDMPALGALYMSRPADQTARVLFDTETDLYHLNNAAVIRPKGRTIRIAVGLLALALVLYLVGLVTGADPKKKTTHTGQEPHHEQPLTPPGATSRPPDLPCGRTPAGCPPGRSPDATDRRQGQGLETGEGSRTSPEGEVAEPDLPRKQPARE